MEFHATYCATSDARPLGGVTQPWQPAAPSSLGKHAGPRPPPCPLPCCAEAKAAHVSAATLQGIQASHADAPPETETTVPPVDAPAETDAVKGGPAASCAVGRSHG